ncbi:TetR/AcrR family transcriptional regulator [Microbacterium sp. MPKO10]|uniref:TetR/AcrR family transcriptional regulator n=1 Tax=Microbacterium sp. MPKO10 TaxID=2989818 RepID=UPI002236B450|nr:TetR/AcrR family transcriptional regulator [Microbacterium sp. MPKO10]MCW4458992.1 TetR/AcrR family transcriptional regulator [Microbacterium sp. MPKO10]
MTSGSRDSTPTFTESARRTQLVTAAIEQVSQHGLAGTSLQKIADAAGLTKAGVIYYFSTKDAVLAAAVEQVTNGIVTKVGADMESAPTAATAIETYIRSMLAYMRDNPTHVALLSESLRHGDGVDTRSRWHDFAGLVEQAKKEGDFRADLDAFTCAVCIGGSIDALVDQWTRNELDLTRAGEQLIEMVRRMAEA